MNDLISRKAVHDALRDYFHMAVDRGLGFDVVDCNADLQEVISEIPIAYDVEKVINQLENKMFSAELYGDEWDGQIVNNLLCMGDVYEIVKDGEIDA